MRHVVAVGEGLSRLGLLAGGPPLSLFDMLLATGGGVRELDVPLWFALLGGSFVFLDMGPSILFLVFPFFGWQGFINVCQCHGTCYNRILFFLNQ